MSLESSIARINALAEKISAAVTTEAAEASAKIAQKEQAIAEKDRAIIELKAALELAKAQAADPVLVAALGTAIDNVESAAGAISEILKSENPTPVTDVVVDAVQSDNAPTPDPIAEVKIDPLAPTPGGESAVEAIAEAVEEIEG